MKKILKAIVMGFPALFCMSVIETSFAADIASLPSDGPRVSAPRESHMQKKPAAAAASEKFDILILSKSKISTVEGQEDDEQRYKGIDTTLRKTHQARS